MLYRNALRLAGSLRPRAHTTREGRPAPSALGEHARPGATPVPRYLQTHYWWAYVHPWAVKVFERPWLVNLILWGNYARLRDAVLAEFGEDLGGRTLQVACVYGDLTPRLVRRVEECGGSLDVVDVLAVQLRNLSLKLEATPAVRLTQMDAARLKTPAAAYDRALSFFLLHEQPARYRARTVRELFRVVKPGGKIVIVDYAQPRIWNPMRYAMWPVLSALEPFALDLWRHELTEWLPHGYVALKRETFFGGLYQKVVITV